MFKNNKLILALSGMMFFCLQACENKSSGKLEGGMEYEFVKDVNGEKTAEGDFITLNVTYKNDKDSVLGSSLDAGIPFVMRKDSTWGSSNAFEDCFNLLDKGDSAIFKIPAKLLFKNQLPPDIAAESIITIFAGLEDILTEEEFNQKSMEWQAIQRKKQMEAARESILENYKGLIEEQGVTIDEYITKNKLEAETTGSGLRYVISEKGSGDIPKTGDRVKVNYTGKLLDGTVFDTSVEAAAKEAGVYNEARNYEPFTFQLGYGQVILGWDEGIGFLNTGSKATIFIPSPLGYGERGSGEIIKPNAILVFDVELVDIIGGDALQ